MLKRFKKGRIQCSENFFQERKTVNRKMPQIEIESAKNSKNFQFSTS